LDADGLYGANLDNKAFKRTKAVVTPLITCFKGSIGKIAGKPQLSFKWAAENADHCTLTVEPDAELTELPKSGSGDWTLGQPPLTQLQATYTLTAVASDGPTAASRLALSWTFSGSWSRPSERQMDTVPHDMVFSPDGSRLYVANHSEVSVFTPTQDDNRPLQKANLAITGDWDTEYNSVAVSPDGSRLYVAANVPACLIWVYDASDLRQIGDPVLIGDVKRPAPTVRNMAVWTHGNASYLFVATLGYTSQILVFTITSESSNPLQAFGSPLSIPNVVGLRISPDAKQLYLLTTPMLDGVPGASTIEVYQPTGFAGNQLNHIASHALGIQGVLGFGVAPGLKYLAALFDQQCQVSVFDADSMTVGAPSASVGGQGFTIESIAIARDGSRVYFGYSRPGDPENQRTDINVLVPNGLSGGTPCTSPPTKEPKSSALRRPIGHSSR
jgi:DNA-binding beta-propeller fold protein YncE